MPPATRCAFSLSKLLSARVFSFIKVLLLMIDSFLRLSYQKGAWGERSTSASDYCIPQKALRQRNLRLAGVRQTR